MIADSACMFVDALTYLFNLIAERRKTAFDKHWSAPISPKSRDERKRIRRRAKRKLILEMDLIPTFVSMTTLIIVTVFVLRHAIHILILDTHRDVSLKSDPNLLVMFCFSVANLLLDLLNVTCFARAKRLLGFETKAHSQGSEQEYESLLTDEVLEATNLELTGGNVQTPQHCNKIPFNDDELDVDASDTRLDPPAENARSDYSPDPPGTRIGNVDKEIETQFTDDSDSSTLHDDKGETNLNMCSAYTVCNQYDCLEPCREALTLILFPHSHSTSLPIRCEVLP